MVQKRPVADAAAAVRRGRAPEVALTLERFEPVGIVASGTIVHGSPSPPSGTDLSVVDGGPRHQTLQRTFHGVPVEIFVSSPERVLAYFDEERVEARPVTACSNPTP
jgi:hypothetical protein